MFSTLQNSNVSSKTLCHFILSKKKYSTYTNTTNNIANIYHSSLRKYRTSRNPIKYTNASDNKSCFILNILIMCERKYNHIIYHVVHTFSIIIYIDVLIIYVVYCHFFVIEEILKMSDDVQILLKINIWWHRNIS